MSTPSFGLGTGPNSRTSSSQSSLGPLESSVRTRKIRYSNQSAQSNYFQKEIVNRQADKNLQPQWFSQSIAESSPVGQGPKSSTTGNNIRSARQDNRVKASNTTPQHLKYHSHSNKNHNASYSNSSPSSSTFTPNVSPSTVSSSSTRSPASSNVPVTTTSKDFISASAGSTTPTTIYKSQQPSSPSTTTAFFSTSSKSLNSSGSSGGFSSSKPTSPPANASSNSSSFPLIPSFNSSPTAIPVVPSGVWSANINKKLPNKNNTAMGGALGSNLEKKKKSSPSHNILNNTVNTSNNSNSNYYSVSSKSKVNSNHNSPSNNGTNITKATSIDNVRSLIPSQQSLNGTNIKRGVKNEKGKSLTNVRTPISYSSQLSSGVVPQKTVNEEPASNFTCLQKSSAFSSSNFSRNSSSKSLTSSLVTTPSHNNNTSNVENVVSSSTADVICSTGSSSLTTSNNFGLKKNHSSGSVRNSGASTYDGFFGTSTNNNTNSSNLNKTSGFFASSGGSKSNSNNSNNLFSKSDFIKGPKSINSVTPFPFLSNSTATTTVPLSNSSAKEVKLDTAILPIIKNNSDFGSSSSQSKNSSTESVPSNPTIISSSPPLSETASNPVPLPSSPVDICSSGSNSDENLENVNDLNVALRAPFSAMGTLSRSLEEEERFMQRLGWRHDGDQNGFTGSITEEEMLEFKLMHKEYENNKFKSSKYNLKFSSLQSLREEQHSMKSYRFKSKEAPEPIKNDHGTSSFSDPDTCDYSFEFCSNKIKDEGLISVSRSSSRNSSNSNNSEDCHFSVDKEDNDFLESHNVLDESNFIF